VSRTDTLKSLEVVLESFLRRAVALKGDRLRVLDGINRLDDIARSSHPETGQENIDLTDRIGDWLAEHSYWIEEKSLRPGDQNRLEQILANIREKLPPADDTSPAGQKIAAEIDRWRSSLTGPPAAEKKPSSRAGRKIILRKGPETLDEAGVHPSGQDSIGLFTLSLQAITELFDDLSRDRLHLMSILNDTLKTATLQTNREALLLSALIIYYLKQNGYMVEPFVKRLRDAERLQKGAGSNA